MRVLLDECVPRKLLAHFSGHDCVTATQAGFAGQKNGALLAAAELAGFEVLVSMDKGVHYQQNARGRSIRILVLRARSNRLADLIPLVPECLTIMEQIEPGDLAFVGTSKPQ